MTDRTGYVDSPVDAPREERPDGTLPASPWPARLAAVVTLLDVPIHVWWALGGTFLLPGGRNVAELPQTRVANAVVSGVLLVGAAVLLLVGGRWSRPRPGSRVLAGGGRTLPAFLLAAIGAGAAVCLSHGLYGVVTKALFLSGVDAVRFPDVGGRWSAAQRHTAAVLDLAVFEPWFLLEGVLLALAGWQYVRTRRGRRRWAAAVSGGTVLILLFGLVLAMTGRRVAVG